MRTPYRDGMIDVRLLKTETDTILRARELIAKLSVMQPIRKEVSEAAVAAGAILPAIDALMALVGCDAPEHLPLIDGQAQPAAQAAATETGTVGVTPAADAVTPPADAEATPPPPRKRRSAE